MGRVMETTMANKDESLNLTAVELAKTFADPNCASKFPPVLTVDQAAADAAGKVKAIMGGL